MDHFYEELSQSLQTGFIDENAFSNNQYLPGFLVNDKIERKKVFSTLSKELTNCDTFWFSVAFATTSGVVVLKNKLKELEDDNKKGKILVSQYQNFTQPKALTELLQFKNIELKIVVEGNFHAKGYLFKKGDIYDLIIGSSNLTQGALLLNKEWNLKISATEHSNIIGSAIKEFKKEFETATTVNEKFINEYEKIYAVQKKFYLESQKNLKALTNKKIEPNSMQRDALKNLANLRIAKKNKALLISATGTGKTYLAAFDTKCFNPKKCLFVVHRGNIAETAMKSFNEIFENKRSMGLYTGNKKEIEADFIFSTIQTLSRDNHLNQFDKSYFDYIIVDETHHAGAESYQKILNYFEPKFLLGMTATPERMDGFDIFKAFDYNIAYEIRLNRALDEQMLCPFHYFGVTDVTVNDKLIETDAGFNLLVAKERVDRIIEKAKFYGCDGSVRGLIFCRRKEECIELSSMFNKRGYRTLALTAESSEDQRSIAILRLESDNELEKLDYIITVDIFNEGVDIPKVNQIIMLRPTQSAIVFVQQLGRGLRKIENKEYVTVIDFIGNYNNSYLIPIALFGDTSYNKDTLRKLMTSGSNLIPGASTINFEKIARDRIFEAINNSNLQTKKDLLNDYNLLKFKIGRIPTMMDFIEHGSRDPFLFVLYSNSYYGFTSQIESSLKNKLGIKKTKLLELFSLNIANGKRIEETIMLKELIKNKKVSAKRIKEIVLNEYGVSVSDATINSCISNLNFEFIGDPKNVVLFENNHLSFTDDFSSLLKDELFTLYLSDVLNYSHYTYGKAFENNIYVDGFILYQKYSRRDVCRILNWEKNEESTVYGYKIKNETCPIFVTYHKKDDIAETTKYEDRFVSNSEFEWMSRSRRTLESSEIVAIRNFSSGLRIPLFIKKSDGEGTDFYYMGDVIPETFTATKMKDGKGLSVPVVKVNYNLNHPVEDSIYDYITSS